MLRRKSTGSAVGASLLRLMIVMLILLLAASAAQAQIGNYERVIVPQLAGRAIPADPSLTAYLFKPTGAGPFPAIVLMHGCDGLGWATPQRTSWKLQKSYAERYAERGYAALVLDSFAPRRLTNICGEGQRVTGVQRAWDAFAAADFLVMRGVADPKRLVLQGGSHGGYAQAYTQTYIYAEPRAYARPSTQYVLVPVQQSGGYAYAYAYR